MPLFLRALAANDSRSNDNRIICINAPDSDGLAEKVDVPVAIAGVCSGLDFDNIAVIGIVDCRLDVVEICGVIVINSDYPGTAWNGCQQANKNND